jgi:hypothetical protein
MVIFKLIFQKNLTEFFKLKTNFSKNILKFHPLHNHLSDANQNATQN